MTHLPWISIAVGLFCLLLAAVMAATPTPSLIGTFPAMPGRG